jgi:hypothetical protein
MLEMRAEDSEIFFPKGPRQKEEGHGSMRRFDFLAVQNEMFQLASVKIV